MKERDIIPKVMKYVRDVMQETCAVEVKLARGISIPFSALEEHQERALLLASTSAIYHKIADGSGQQTPFDAFCLSRVAAYVAVVWEDSTTFILIDKWIAEHNNNSRKSLTSARAKEIALKVIHLRC